MDVTESLFRALTLLGLGMTFVFLFLGLLMIAVNLMAKYIPADEPAVKRSVVPRKQPSTVSSESEINPKLIAAISSAVQQYRKTEAA
ncbi:oxaloacetate decarboxylase subunit gamma [Psychromonas aquimarina]|uniref:oxaloacetate decarboxylase subunit gamma n=1 Tax=Psychromonas aquimarina TaxID=444919 RepID=UPI00041CBA14|nr:oxaloacetate decarboxylase subunit gamma [Psychromonas aquimarina]